MLDKNDFRELERLYNEGLHPVELSDKFRINRRTLDRYIEHIHKKKIMEKKVNGEVINRNEFPVRRETFDRYVYEVEELIYEIRRGL